MLNDLLFNPDSIIKMADPGIGTYVRYWLHYNNLASSFYKQYSAAKKIQEDYVQQIIDSLVKSRMEKAIIQINGGQISVIDKKTPHQLSLSKVQDYLHAYYKQRGGRDETKDIMLFINANRGYTVQKVLKKSGIPAPTGGIVPQILPPTL
jgi:hypothetical protein